MRGVATAKRKESDSYVKIAWSEPGGGLNP
jgi:hypothetical protein